MSYEDLVRLFRDVGFPVAVAGYVLVRIDRTLNGLRREIAALRAALLEHRAHFDPARDRLS